MIAVLGLASLLLGQPTATDQPATEPPDPPEPVEAQAPPAETEAPAPTVDPALIDAAIARLPAGPSLREVQDAALRRAGVDPRAASRWLRRSRVAAALPAVSVQVDQRLDRGWTLDREVGQSDALRSDAGTQAVIRAKATWELDRLLFTPDELRAARAALDLAEVRERVLVEVTALYFERERLLIERMLVAAPDLDTAIASALRLREVEGLLTGLTGLEFATSAPQ